MPYLSSSLTANSTKDNACIHLQLHCIQAHSNLLCQDIIPWPAVLPRAGRDRRAHSVRGTHQQAHRVRMTNEQAHAAQGTKEQAHAGTREQAHQHRPRMAASSTRRPNPCNSHMLCFNDVELLQAPCKIMVLGHAVVVAPWWVAATPMWLQQPFIWIGKEREGREVRGVWRRGRRRGRRERRRLGGRLRHHCANVGFLPRRIRGVVGLVVAVQGYRWIFRVTLGTAQIKFLPAGLHGLRSARSSVTPCWSAIVQVVCWSTLSFLGRP